MGSFPPSLLTKLEPWSISLEVNRGRYDDGPGVKQQASSFKRQATSVKQQAAGVKVTRCNLFTEALKLDNKE